MIHEVDETLRLMMRQEALQGADIDILFETPTKEWASRRNTPTIDVFLYDIREDLGRREEGVVDVRNDEGRVTGRRRPPRYYKLSYLVTAWTQRPEDEHRLLSACMAAFLKHGVLPQELLVGSLEELGLAITVNIALPPPQDRSISDIWTALGGELKPSLELVVVAPLETNFPIHVGPAITEPPMFGLRRAEGAVVDRNRPHIPGTQARSVRRPGERPDAEVAAGQRRRRRRRYDGTLVEEVEVTPVGKAKRVKVPAAAGAKGRAAVASAPADATMPEAWDEVDDHVITDPLPEEALVMGSDGTGRVFRVQGMPRKRS